MVKETQLYDLLQISVTADEQEIRKAYKTLALKYHPDKQPTDDPVEKERMTEMFKSISEAYDILTDINKRYLYDTYGEEVAKNPESQTSVFSTNNYQYDHADLHNQVHNHFSQHQKNFADHFQQNMNMHNMMNSHAESMFNNFFGTFKSPFDNINMNMNHLAPPQQQPTYTQSRSHHHHYQYGKVSRGHDIKDNIQCTLLDYYNGRNIRLKLSKRLKCPKCNALGGSKIYTCNDCCGSGVIVNEMRNGMMYQRSQTTCNRCHGTGKFIPDKYICEECGGNKLIDTKVIFDFNTPRGVSNGYKIIFPNAADEGINLIPGDVVLTLVDDVHVGASTTTNYKRVDNDLLITISIPLHKALCGGVISFDHINGKQLDVMIQRGDIKSGHSIKILKGHGMPIHESTNANDQEEENGDAQILEDKDLNFGDLIIKFNVDFPDLTKAPPKHIDLLNGILDPSAIAPHDHRSSISSSSDDVSSVDELSSLKLTSQTESRNSSIEKTNDNTNPNLNIPDASKSQTRKRSIDAIPEFKLPNDIHNALQLQDYPDLKQKGISTQDFPVSLTKTSIDMQPAAKRTKV